MKIDLYYDHDEQCTYFVTLEAVTVADWIVPAGTISDGASVPRAFWGICTPIDGRYIEIFTWHDYAYREHLLTRDEVDQIMRDLLVKAGMSKVKAYTIYRAVRAFGSAHW